MHINDRENEIINSYILYNYCYAILFFPLQLIYFFINTSFHQEIEHLSFKPIIVSTHGEQFTW